MKKVEDLTCDDIATPRYARGQRFANSIMSALRDFLPQDRRVQPRIHEFLFEIGYNQNLEIIEVPPEFDALTKLQLERMKVETHPAFVKPPGL